MAEHLAREPDLDPLDLIHVPAEMLRPAMRRLSGAPEIEPEPEAVAAQEPAGEAAAHPADEPQAPAEEPQATGALPQADESPLEGAKGEEPPGRP